MPDADLVVADLVVVALGLRSRLSMPKAERQVLDPHRDIGPSLGEEEPPRFRMSSLEAEVDIPALLPGPSNMVMETIIRI